MQDDAVYDVNGKVDEMREIWIEPDELIFIELGLAGTPLEPDILHQQRTAVPEQRSENSLAAIFLAQDTARGDLAKARGGQVDPELELVLQAAVCRSLPGRNNDPRGAGDFSGLHPVPAFPADLLDDGAQIFKALAASRDVLVHFIQNESE